MHEPTLARVHTAAEIGVDMISLCTQLDVLCKKELVEVSCFTEHKFDSCRLCCKLGLSAIPALSV